MDISIYLKEKRGMVDSYLKSYFSTPFEPSVLHEAIKYSLFAGGKRIRPILALASYEACGGNPEDIIPYASAMELIHTYSLIHDDLPSMDNDDLRRGKPTNHKVFGEAIAILAGDALLTEAFSMLSNLKIQNFGTSFPLHPSSLILHPSSFIPHPSSLIPHPSSLIPHPSILRVIHEVAMAAGIHGMVGGQVQDILSENSEPDRDILSFIHLHKTAALITASVRMGPLLAESDKDKLHALTRYGENMGLVFQIIDDILDIEGSTEELGKSAGSDRKSKKMTYPALYGIEMSRQKAENLVSEAIDELKIFFSEADPLREIASYLIKRRN